MISNSAMDEVATELPKGPVLLPYEVLPAEVAQSGAVDIENYQFHPSLTGGVTMEAKEPELEEVPSNNGSCLVAQNADSLEILAVCNYHQLNNDHHADRQHLRQSARPAPTFASPA